MPIINTNLGPSIYVSFVIQQFTSNIHMASGRCIVESCTTNLEIKWTIQGRIQDFEMGGEFL